MTWKMFVQALIKSFPLGIVVISIVIYALIETIENKWNERCKNVKCNKGKSAN